MIFFPAIDLNNGECVRLFRGDLKQMTVFNDNPPAQAKFFEKAGCQWIHVVDLNGAFQGKPVNGKAIKRIINEVSIPIELGGGIRDRGTIDMWLSEGISRVVLGTVALNNPKLVHEACRAYPNKIAVGIDAKVGKVAVEGWSKTSRITPLELAQQFEDAGVSVIIFTDIDRDGAMIGPNLEATLQLAQKISIPVILSGGVSSMEDLKTLKHLGEGVLEGVICGRAVYDGRINLRDATKLMNERI